MTALHELLGVEHPVLQAPMAGSQGSRLAIAVSLAGGLGALPCAMLEPETIVAEARAIEAATSRPFNLNFFCHRDIPLDPAIDAAWRERLAVYANELRVPDRALRAPSRAPFSDVHAACVEAVRPRVVSFHFGLPSEALIRRVKDAGALVLSSATTAEEAAWLERRGADVIIAQGAEAGGHRGMFLAEDLENQPILLDLIPAIRRVTSLPIVAAGGITTADDVARARRAGADGVQVGTAYLFTPEAGTTPLHRAALRDARGRETTLTNVFTGRPARGLANRIVREVGPIAAAAPPFPHAASAIAPLRAAAEAAGSDDFSPLWAGTSAARCVEQSAADLTRALALAFAPP